MWRDLNHLRYDNLSTLILILFLTILTIDLISLIIRNYLRKSSINFKSIESYRRFQISKTICIPPIIIIGLLFLVFKSLDISYDRLLIGLSQGSTIIKRMIRIDMSYYPKLIEGVKESFFYSYICHYCRLVMGYNSFIFNSI